MPGIDYNPYGELTVRMGTLDQVAFMIDGMQHEILEFSALF